MNTCGHCANPLSPNSRSLYFCGASCQDQWMKANSEPLQMSTHLPADDHVLSERIRSRLGVSTPGKDAA